MSIIEFIGICGILVGIFLPIVGTWRYFINNAALQRLDKRRLSFFIGINVFLVIIIIGAIIVSKTIAQPATTTATYISLLIVGIVSTLIGIATFLYQTHVSARLNASIQIAEQQQTDDQDKDLKLYLDKLRNDPHITYIQILDMSRPLDTLQTYVDTRLDKITTSHLKRDSSLQALWVNSDPNVLLQASRSSSEKSTTSALGLEQAIRKYKHCVILGDPGSGKTTLLKYLTLKSLEETIVNRLQTILISTPYTLTRQQVAMSLVEFDASKMNRHLLDILANEEIKPEVRQSVADALGMVGNRWLVADLPELLANRQISYSVRERIVKALGKLGDRSITDDLLQLLSDPNIEPSMFELIIETLGLLGEPSIAPVLLRLLRDQQLDVNVRASIASSLGRLGNRAIVSDLLQLLSDDQLDVNVRMNIATALGELGERSIAPGLIRQLSKQPEEPFVQQRIALALGVLGESSVIPDLLQLLANEQLALNVRTSIARTLGRLGNCAIASDLLQLLTRERLDPQVAISIANTLSTLGETSVIPGLLTLLSDKQVNFNVRASIAATLGSLGVSSVIPDLLLFLSDEQTLWLIGQHITTALRTLGDRSVVPILLQLLSDEQINPSARQWIADVLGTLGDGSTVPSLVVLLSDGRISSFVRSSIADAIGTIGEASVALALLSLLLDERCDLSVRQSITSALATLNDHSVLPGLFQLLLTQQEYPAFCESIANTIGQLAEDEVSARKLAELLLIKMGNAEVEDTIHHALWKVSRRARTRVFITNSSDGKQIDMYNQKGTKISHPLEQDIQRKVETAKEQQQDETELSNSAEQDIQQWMQSVSQNQSPKKALIFDKEQKKLILVTSDDLRLSNPENLPIPSEPNEETDSNEENVKELEGTLRQWMESVSQNQQQKKILIFDKKLQKLVPVAPDDPRLQDSTNTSFTFGFEEAKRFGHEDTRSE